jgi:hypothetical protein
MIRAETIDPRKGKPAVPCSGQIQKSAKFKSFKIYESDSEKSRKKLKTLQQFFIPQRLYARPLVGG